MEASCTIVSNDVSCHVTLALSFQINKQLVYGSTSPKREICLLCMRALRPVLFTILLQYYYSTKSLRTVYRQVNTNNCVYADVRN